MIAQECGRNSIRLGQINCASSARLGLRDPQGPAGSLQLPVWRKLRCRMIMVDNLAKAQDIWERPRKNTGGFEKIA